MENQEKIGKKVIIPTLIKDTSDNKKRDDDEEDFNDLFSSSSSDESTNKANEKQKHQMTNQANETPPTSSTINSSTKINNLAQVNSKLQSLETPHYQSNTRVTYEQYRERHPNDCSPRRIQDMKTREVKEENGKGQEAEIEGEDIGAEANRIEEEMIATHLHLEEEKMTIEGLGVATVDIMIKTRVVQEDETHHLNLGKPKHSKRYDVKSDNEEFYKKLFNKIESKPGTKSIHQKINEAIKVAQYCYLLNETKWNAFDDEFYVINRRWFDKWKNFVSYDYIVNHVMNLNKPMKDLSINKILNSGCSHPGDVTNKFLIMDQKDFYHHRVDFTNYTNFPIKEDQKLDRDYFITAKGVWKILYNSYDGLEIVRFSIAKDKIGKAYRDALLPKVKIALMRRGEKLKYPKQLNLQRKQKFKDLKVHLKNIFQFLTDTNLTDIRLWLFSDEEMGLDEFLESYNNPDGIAGNLTHTFEFPGHSLENKLECFIDEYKSVQTNKTVFIEVKRSGHQWIFNLESRDQSKFYHPTESEIWKLQYMLNDMDDRDTFFDYNFSYNLYWKNRNHTIRDYFDQSYQDINLYEEFVQMYNNLKDSRQIMDQGDNKRQSHSVSSTENKCGFCGKIKSPMLESCLICNGVKYCNLDCKQNDQKFHQKTVCDKYLKNQAKAALKEQQREQQREKKLQLLQQKAKLKKKQKRVYDNFNELESDEEWHGSEDDLENTIFSGQSKRARRGENSQSQKVANEDSNKENSEENKINMEVEVEDDQESELKDKKSDFNNTQTESVSSKESDSQSHKRRMKMVQKQHIKQMRGRPQATKAPVSRNLKQKEQESSSSSSTESEPEESQASQSNEGEEKESQKEPEKELTLSQQISRFSYNDHKFIIGNGISNIGNNCYMNSIIQALAMNIKLKMKLQQYSNVENLEIQKPIVFSLLKIFNEIKVPSGGIQTTINPTYFKLALSLKSDLFKGNDQFDAQEFLSYFLFEGKLKQEIRCKSCNFVSTTIENFNYLSLPIEFQSDKSNYTRLRIIYIFDIDKFKKYEILFKPAQYLYKNVFERVKNKISQDRKELKSGKKTFIMVDLKDSCELASVLMGENMLLTFGENKEFTTYAYEVYKCNVEKLLPINFLHITKEEYDFQNRRQAYEDIFFGPDSEQPYSLYLLMKDHTRVKLDMRQNKKLFKTYDLSSVIRTEIEFNMAADFQKMREEFNKIQEQGLPEKETKNEIRKLDLETCIKNFAKPELITGNQWLCQQCLVKRDCVKFTYLQKEPESLIIHLKRFNVDPITFQRKRLEHIIKFPTSKFKFSKVFHEGSGVKNMDGIQLKKYTLQAVVQHRNGIMGDGGHYVTYCRDEKEKQWYLYDDSKVQKLNPDRKKEEIINSNSYLLFYRIKDEDERSDTTYNSTSNSANNTTTNTNTTINKQKQKKRKRRW
ncbi:ubiquitin carboxyl-terminal hydrolase [Stylonychia lemnae]|uniref:Ubiquitin carboxyl-terminal hydrolase n=1 Tax=Stylonychia lemnae TaxID=5949 RepID=A0A078AQY0_STYLE|nr:ubiquitin carboxyl-terminal hydrolase [Stylonychia lemnae]|eukprot:CDW84830.1 ubiquitin carboxyl-terminal hydrolase [Stylonychia lemnae]